MGYTGGTKIDPTYRDLGDHSEAIQIDFDPARISYEELLKLALKEGNFVTEGWSRQYRSAVFYGTESQKRAAQKLGLKQLEPLATFTRAEDYHQKYYLQQSSLVKEFYRRYPDAQSFTDSTAVAKANAILGGNLDAEQLKVVVPLLEVSEETAQKLYEMAGTPKGGCALPADSL